MRHNCVCVCEGGGTNHKLHSFTSSPPRNGYFCVNGTSLRIVEDIIVFDDDVNIVICYLCVRKTDLLFICMRIQNNRCKVQVKLSLCTP